MKGIHAQTEGRFLAILCLAAAAALPLGRVDAGGSSPADRCAIALPPQLAFTGGGPGTAVYTLHGTAGTLRFMLFGPHGLSGELRLLGYRPLPGETVGEFELVTAGGAHIYAGPVHIFQHAISRQVCRAGAIMVDAHGNTTEQRNPYLLRVRIDGVIRPQSAAATVWIGNTRATFSGARSR